MSTLQVPTKDWSLRPVDSALTLTNSPYSTAPSSRQTSPTRLKQGQMDVLSKGAVTTTRFLSQELDVAWMGSVVIACFFVSGLIDSVAFNSWNCFVGMQTGNTVFAALGIGGQPQASHFQQYFKSLTSIGSFCLGTLFFNAMHRWPTGLKTAPSSRRRSIFVLSFFIQTLLITVAAIMVTLDLVSNQPFVAGTFSSGSRLSSESTRNQTNYLDLCPVAILAFEAAGQVCLSRVLSLIELPTIVLSTLYHDFTADLYGLRDSWRKSTSILDFVLVQQRRQEKRLFSIIALFVGGLVGGEMYKSSAGMAGALWTAAGLKGAITIAFLVWKKNKSDELILPK